MLYCIILYCIILFILGHIILHYIISYYIILDHMTWYYIISFYVMLCYIVLYYCSTLCQLHHFILYCVILCFTMSYSISACICRMHETDLSTSVELGTLRHWFLIVPAHWLQVVSGPGVDGCCSLGRCFAWGGVHPRATDGLGGSAGGVHRAR